MRKVSIRTVENTIGLARSVANGTTKFPFMGYCADLMEKMLEEIKKARKAPDFIPLYTHPAKTLTDKEMKDLIQEYWGDVHIVDPDGFLHEIAFIKAILKKAQEK